MKRGGKRQDEDPLVTASRWLKMFAILAFVGALAGAFLIVAVVLKTY